MSDPVTCYLAIMATAGFVAWLGAAVKIETRKWPFVRDPETGRCRPRD